MTRVALSASSAASRTGMASTWMSATASSSSSRTAGSLTVASTFTISTLGTSFGRSCLGASRQVAPYRRCQPTVEWASRGAVLAVHIVARGKTNGAEVDVRFYPHFKLRDDGVVYIYDYAHRAEALAAVGLGEWAMSQETVRLAREVLDALGTHDAARLIELSDPEVEWRSFFALSE